MTAAVLLTAALATPNARLLVLDTLLPGQCLRCEAPPQLFRDLVSTEQAPLVACGRNRLTLHSRGCEVAASVDGDDVLLTATGKLCEIVEEGADEGSRWAGRAGTVEWLGSLGDDDYCLSNEDTYALAKAKEHGSSLGKEENPERLARLGVRLGDLAEEWATLVRATNRERVPGQLDAIQASLGAMPEALNARAVHIAALVNPLPALGVALEIRPAVLTARTTSRRLSMAEDGLRDSIRRLQRPGPCF